MIANTELLLKLAPIKDMETQKRVHAGSNTSYGLSEAGYDIRIKQTIRYIPTDTLHFAPVVDNTIPKSIGVNRIGFKKVRYDTPVTYVGLECFSGNFVLASAIEEFDMPDNLVGIVHDKSSWARRGLSVFNTVIEPGWKGFLTLELVFHGNETVEIPAGSGIAQVIFSQLSNPAAYAGKYQNQENKPVRAK